MYNILRLLLMPNQQQNKTMHFFIGLINRRFSEKSPNHKLTEKQVRKVCELLEEHPNLSLKAIAEIVGCHDANVESIKYRKAWKSVSKNYKFHSSRKYKA